MKTSKFACFLVVIALSSRTIADDTPTPKGNFMSSLKQSFRQDYDHEVVRGHFDIGTPPNTHRYYCLVDPKSGRHEENGIAGTPTPKRDGTTGIQGASVSFYSCADAESKGLLITTDYHMNTVAGAPSAAAASPGTQDRPLKLNTTDPMATLQSFIDVFNGGDGAALVSLLGESADFAWVQADGHTVWGYQAATEALQASRSAGSQLQLQSQEGHTISLASKTAILITKLRLTQTTQDPRIIRCSGVIVQTPKGWRIASLFMTPEAG